MSLMMWWWCKKFWQVKKMPNNQACSQVEQKEKSSKDDNIQSLDPLRNNDFIMFLKFKNRINIRSCIDKIFISQYIY